jgi:hypothetical protein
MKPQQHLFRMMIRAKCVKNIETERHDEAREKDQEMKGDEMRNKRFPKEHRADIKEEKSSVKLVSMLLLLILKKPSRLSVRLRQKKPVKLSREYQGAEKRTTILSLISDSSPTTV